MQKKMEELQTKLAEETMEISSGGGAVKVTITLQQEIKSIELDGDFLKEEKEFVEETILEAVREALAKSKEKSEAAMSELTEGMQIPGLM